MKPVPTTALVAYSVASAGQTNAAAVPTATTAAPAAIGRRTPTRSTHRPMLTADNIGTTAKSAASVPTVNGEAPRLIAVSATVTRAPAKARCVRIVTRTTKE